jgi:tetratricopeptide (TPR) repeat protein
MSVDIFVSYAGPDRPWAEWVASQVEAAGLSVELDAWDWAAGSNFVLNMNDALARASRVVALYSKAYFDRSRYTTEEWAAAVAARQRLLPLRVEEVEPPPILLPLVWVDIFGIEEAHARARVRNALLGRKRPTAPVPFPGAGPAPSDGVRVPGSLPTVWNVPPRLRAFTGRQALLAALRERLTSGERAVVLALHGMGGVGKTQLAIEYAHLFAGEYDLVWWIDAERAELIGEQSATLGVRAGWVEPGTADATALAAVQDRLRSSARWLVIFDNVESAADLDRWLLPETGHTVITSRSGAFGGMAVSLSVDVFTRAESVELVRRVLPDADAGALAEALGDLPLALAQAIGLIEQTQMPVAEYLAELRGRAREVLAEGRPLRYPATLAATVELSVRRVREEDPAAVELLHSCAHLAPEPIPVAWLAAAPSWEFRRSLGRLARLGLARITEDTIQLHRLTQAVMRDLRTSAERDRDRQRVEELLATAAPADSGEDPWSWPAWASLLPHLLAFDPAEAGPTLRSLGCRALWYLLMRGEYAAAKPLAQAWHQRWLDRLGPDDEHTRRAASRKARAYYYLGDYARALGIDEDLVARERRLLGEDDPETLACADDLAGTLRQLQRLEEAHVLFKDVLARRERVLGKDHPATLTSAHNLAECLWALGRYAEALSLIQDVLTQSRIVPGEDHPFTLLSAHLCAIVLSYSGESASADALFEDTVVRQRRVLGEDHPDTRHTETNFAAHRRRMDGQGESG